jgi:hypothetical protein
MKAANMAAADEPDDWNWQAKTAFTVFPAFYG